MPKREARKSESRKVIHGPNGSSKSQAPRSRETPKPKFQTDNCAKPGWSLESDVWSFPRLELWSQAVARLLSKISERGPAGPAVAAATASHTRIGS